jgi:hypothetical protein
VWNIQSPLPTAQFWPPAAQHAAATSRPRLGATLAGTAPYGMGPGGWVEKPRRSNGIWKDGVVQLTAMGSSTASCQNWPWATSHVAATWRVPGYTLHTAPDVWCWCCMLTCGSVVFCFKSRIRPCIKE